LNEKVCDQRKTVLSPLSSLTSGLDNLTLMNDNHDASMINNNFTTTPLSKPFQTSSEIVKNSLAQFCTIMVTNICESVPDVDPEFLSDTELADWIGGVISHWAVLRRQVNNWRSDPQQRFLEIDWGKMAVNLIEMLGDQLTLELGAGLERETCGRMLRKIARMSITNTNQSVISNDTHPLANFNTTREVSRLCSNVDLSGVKEIQRLALLLATFILEGSLPSDSIGSLWDIDTTKNWIKTCNVNKARKFLHSNDFDCNKEIDDRKEEDKKLDIESSSSAEGQDPVWKTPPTSPAESLASMETCDEGIFSFVIGTGPTQQDRRVFETLDHLKETELNDFPAVNWYLTCLRGFSKQEMLSWDKIDYDDFSDNGHNFGLVKKLDMDLTY